MIWAELYEPSVYTVQWQKSGPLLYSENHQGQVLDESLHVPSCTDVSVSLLLCDALREDDIPGDPRRDAPGEPDPPGEGGCSSLCMLADISLCRM